MRIQITGKRFGRWTVLEFAETRWKTSHWKCRCDCGTVSVVSWTSLKKGTSVSCGCFKRELDEKRFAAGLHRTHGLSHKITEYNIWANMLARCRNPKHPAYKDYGGRGIKVCQRWFNFENFLADMGKRPSLKYSIDRFPENDGDYQPDNCRWATQKEQQRNSRMNKRITFAGKTMIALDWAKAFNMKRQTLEDRLKKGWPIARALTQPVKK